MYMKIKDMQYKRPEIQKFNYDMGEIIEKLKHPRR